VKENLNQKRILNTNSYDNSLSNSSKKEKKPSKKSTNNNNNNNDVSGSGLKTKVKPSALPSQVIEIINTKLSNLIDKPHNVEKIKSQPSMGLNFENGEYAYEEDAAAEEDRENNANGGDDTHSESSSSSSSSYQNDESIKEAIRRAAEATGTFTNNRISSSYKELASKSK
jgi:hypothetical protein